MPILEFRRANMPDGIVDQAAPTAARKMENAAPRPVMRAGFAIFLAICRSGIGSCDLAKAWRIVDARCDGPDKLADEQILGDRVGRQEVLVG